MDFIAATMVHGQFDDAVESNSLHYVERQGNAFIDTYDPAREDVLAWSDTPDESGDDDEFNDMYDETCVDDEDWEIAERGAFQHAFRLSLIRI